MTNSGTIQGIKFALLGAAFALLAVTPALSGITFPSAAAASDSDGIHHSIATEGWHGTHAGVGTCPSQGFLANPGVEGQKQILNISWIAKNDEDSGIVGYWGLDHFRENLKVWSFPNGTLFAVKTYNGVFVTPQGAVTPGSTSSPPTGLVQGESSFGTITGGYVGTFTGTFAPGTHPKSGFIGIFDYGGKLSDVLLQIYGNGQVGDKSAYDWESAYFTGVAGFNQSHWGWSYELDPVFKSANSINQWCNYNPPDGGNSGDIYSP